MNLRAVEESIDVVECKFCGWLGRPWHQHHVYKCTDWNLPKGERFKTVEVYCPKCRVLDPFIYYEDPEYKKLPPVPKFKKE